MAKKETAPAAPAETAPVSKPWPKQYEKRQLPVALTPTEMRDIRGQLKNLNDKVHVLEDEKKSTASSYKARIESHQLEISRLIGLQAAESEPRSVKCRWHFECAGLDAVGNPIFHPEKKALRRVEVEGVDGEEDILGEVIEVIAMSDADREQPLPGFEAGAADEDEDDTDEDEEEGEE